MAKLILKTVKGFQRSNQDAKLLEVHERANIESESIRC